VFAHRRGHLLSVQSIYIDSVPSASLSVNLRRLAHVAPTVDTDDLIDSQEVADLLGLSHRNSVSTYLHRYEDFPRPIIERSGGRTRLWVRSEVLRWSDRRECGKRG
jgi:glutathione-regulated potassium-efflux system ancillary protein KefG